VSSPRGSGSRLVGFGLLTCLGGGTDLVAQKPAPAPAVVSVLSLTLEAADSTLRRLADSCAARLAQRLQAAKITVARSDSSSLEQIRGTSGPRFAVQGRLSGSADKLSAELELMDAKTGDELRSYFSGVTDLAGVFRFTDLAAGRIAQVVRERKR
jgi:TolB-like protein